MFDFGCDVGVDLGDAVGQVVSEASGLGDLGCAVGDEPGVVTVAQSMESQAGSDRHGAGAIGWPVSLPLTAGLRIR